MANKDKNGISYGSGRTRNFTCLVYPESAPDDWLEILKEQQVPALVSPLHENDYVRGQDELKKPHYHVLLMFDSVKTVAQAREVCDTFGGVVPPEGRFMVHSIRATARYLCHLDDPDKAQYSMDDVVSIGGADYLYIINMPSDRTMALFDIMDFIDDRNFYRFDYLMRWCRRNRPDWARVMIDSGVYVIKEYLKSRSLGMANMSPEEKELYHEWNFK